jgi:hypothetical protein
MVTDIFFFVMNAGIDPFSDAITSDSHDLSGDEMKMCNFT